MAKKLLLALVWTVLSASAAWAGIRNQELIVPVGHGIYPTNAVFTPNGRYLVTSPKSKWVEGGQPLLFWDVRSGKQLFAFEGDDSTVEDMAVSRSGKHLVTVSWQEPFLKMYEIASGKRTIALSDASIGKLFAVGFSPDGRYVATAGQAKAVHLRDTTTLAVIRSFTGHENPVTALAFSPDGRTLISGSGTYNTAKDIRIWDLASGKQTGSLAGAKGEVKCIAVSPDRRYILACGGSGVMNIWDLETLRPVRTFEGKSYFYKGVFLKNTTDIVAQTSKALLVYDLETGKVKRSFPREYVDFFELTPDESAVVMREKGAGLTMYRMGDFAPVATFNQDIGQGVAEVRISPAGDAMAWVTDDNTVRTFPLSSAGKVTTFEGQGKALRTVDISAGGTWIAAAGEDGIIRIWDAATQTVKAELKGHLKPVDRIRFSDDGSLLVSGGQDASVKLWRMSDFSLADTLGALDEQVMCLDISHDNSLVAASSNGYSDPRKFVLFQVRPRAELSWFSLPRSGMVRHLQFVQSGSDEALVAVMNSGDAYIKTVASKVFSSFDNLNGVTNRCAVSGDKKIVAMASDQTVYLFSPETGKETGRLSGHQGQISSMDFSPSGTLLVTASSDNSIKLWDVRTRKERATFYPLADHDWVVTTPEGLIDGSPDGLTYLYYVDGLNVISLDALFETAYTPNLLTRVLGGEELGAPALQVAELKPPPSVFIVSPENNADIEKEALEVTVKAVDNGGGIDEIRLYHNGKLIEASSRALKKKKAAPDSLTRSFTVTPVAGKNVFKAIAFSQSRVESQPDEILVITRAAGPGSDLYLMVVGINAYRNKKYSLNYAKDDAGLFLDTVKQRGEAIFKTVHVHFLTDADAVKDTMMDHFETVIETAQPQDVFVFYYAGHGVMSEAENGNKPDFYLVPHDVTQLYGRNDLLSEKALSATELIDVSRKIKAQKQLFVLDACQSGGAAELFASRGAAEEKAIIQLARSSGITLLSASGTEQFATEFKALGHGVFTFAMIEGLNGLADGGSKDRKITVKELSAFIEDRVPELTEKHRGQAQWPTSYIRGQDFPIAIVKN